MEKRQAAFRLHAAATGALVGLIWIVQLVHYPGFAYVDPAQWTAFHAYHTTSITIIVLPLMLTELALGGFLWKWSGWHRQFGGLWLLTILTWLSTFVLSVPLHNALASGFAADTIAELVRTNWPRTLLWSVRLLWLLVAWKALTRLLR